MSEQKKSGPLGFVASHKRWFIAGAVLAFVAAGIFWATRSKNAGMPQMQQSVIRTVTLSRGTLDESISATGTVQSEDVSSVTTTLRYTVKEVNVQVGDTVQAGDVICTLDTESLEKNIAKLTENLQESKERALATYEKSQTAVTEAQEAFSEAADKLTKAQQEYDTAKAAYDDATSKTTAFQSQVDEADAVQQDALAQLNSAMEQVNQKQDAYSVACWQWQQALDQGQDATQLQANMDSAKMELDQAQSAIQPAQQALDTAKQEYQRLSAQLMEAQSTVNFTAVSQQYQQCQQALEQAQMAYEQALKTAENAESSRSDALDAYNKATESDELEQLQEELENCVLTAETSGKVTALNATVGNTIDGVAATIQNTDQLKIAISIAEYDIDKVQVGMPARITSDVVDGTIQGTLTQISPTATGGGQTSSGFAAEVTVNDANSGLLIGTNAKVEIVLSSSDNVFSVPLDAIEEQEDGTHVIYVQTGEKDGEQVFEAVPVTVGQENDYYAEISGSELSEGMQVRASVTEEAVTEDDAFIRINMGGAIQEASMGGAIQEASGQAEPARPSGGQGGPGMGG